MRWRGLYKQLLKHEKSMDPEPRSEGEALMALHLRGECIPFASQFRFTPERDYRADFVVWSNYDPSNRVLVEIDGGNRLVRWSPKAHTYVAVGAHIQDTHNTRRNLAVCLGFRVLNFSPKQVKTGEAVRVIRVALNAGE